MKSIFFALLLSITLPFISSSQSVTYLGLANNVIVVRGGLKVDSSITVPIIHDTNTAPYTTVPLGSIALYCGTVDTFLCIWQPGSKWNRIGSPGNLNIGNTDLTLSGNRIVHGDNRNLTFDSVNYYGVKSSDFEVLVDDGVNLSASNSVSLVSQDISFTSSGAGPVRVNCPAGFAIKAGSAYMALLPDPLTVNKVLRLPNFSGQLQVYDQTTTTVLDITPSSPFSVTTLNGAYADFGVIDCQSDGVDTADLSLKIEFPVARSSTCFPTVSSNRNNIHPYIKVADNTGFTIGVDGVMDDTPFKLYYHVDGFR